MSSLLSNSFFPVFGVLAFVAIVLLIEALYLMWNSYKGPEAKRVEGRLRALSAAADHSEQAAILKDRMLGETPLFERLLLRLPRIDQIERMLAQSGLRWTTSSMLIASALIAMVVYALLGGVSLVPLLRPALALAAALLPFGYVLWKRAQRLRTIERQLPDTLDLIGRALRAGHALPSGLQMAGAEMAAPIATEFRITHDEINFGVSMQQALLNLTQRVPLTDLGYFVVAVLIQREAGGNLTEVLGNLSNLIRNRLKFKGRVKVLTTEGSMSAWVLGCLPFAMVGLLYFVNYEFVSVLWTDPAGIAIVKALLFMMAIGAFWLYRLVKFRV